MDQIRVLEQPLEVVKSFGDGPAESRDAILNVAHQRIAAGELVKGVGVVGLDFGQMFVRLEALVEFAATRLIVAQNPPGFGELRVAFDDPFHEADFDIQIPLFLAGQLPFCTAFIQHTGAQTHAYQFSRSGAATCGFSSNEFVSASAPSWFCKHFVLRILIGGIEG